MNSYTCKVCGSENNAEIYILKEMMFGMLDEFEYFKCENCKCLQIKEFPANIGKYYPKNYLSFSIVKQSSLKTYLLRKRDEFAISGKGLIGELLSKKFGHPDIFSWFSEANLNKNDSTLDVGCGRGQLLFKLQSAGFNNLLGIDPFIEKEIVYNENLRILKKKLPEIQDLHFDWIMFHHVFEHMENPNETFAILKKILKRNGSILIRIPVIDSYAWEFYKRDWVQLDPPRHYFLHTVKSIEYLSGKYGFKINKILYDSTSFQFWGSEQYKRQIPLMSEISHFVSHGKSIFSREEIKQFEDKAKELNKNRKGDTACFYLQSID